MKDFRAALDLPPETVTHVRVMLTAEQNALAVQVECQVPGQLTIESTFVIPLEAARSLARGIDDTIAKAAPPRIVVPH